MKLDIIQDLERLASHLETKAKTAGALAEEHAKTREFGDQEKQQRRAASGLHFAVVCREAARRLKSREKRAGFVPPSWEELLDYCREKHPAWPTQDVLSWFNHFESCGWKIGTGKQMVKWERAADNGAAKWKEKNPGRAEAFAGAQAGKPKSDDPEGWSEYLAEKDRPYKPFRFEQEYIRTAFTHSFRLRP